MWSRPPSTCPAPSSRVVAQHRPGRGEEHTGFMPWAQHHLLRFAATADGDGLLLRLGRLAEQGEAQLQARQRLRRAVGDGKAPHHHQVRGRRRRRAVVGRQVQHQAFQRQRPLVADELQAAPHLGFDVAGVRAHLGQRQAAVAVVVDTLQSLHRHRHDHEAAGADQVERAALGHHQVRVRGRWAISATSASSAAAARRRQGARSAIQIPTRMLSPPAAARAACRRP